MILDRLKLVLLNLIVLASCTIARGYAPLPSAAIVFIRSALKRSVRMPDCMGL